MIILTLIFIFLLFFIIYYIEDKQETNKKGTQESNKKIRDIDSDVCDYRVSKYNESIYDKERYNIDGRNSSGKYNRLYDKRSYIHSSYNREGFLNPKRYPVSLTTHARERIYERMSNSNNINVDKLVEDAYAYGKSSCQLMKTSALLLKEIEEKYNEKRIGLIYNGYIYIFSEENVLITMYKNEKIII